MDEREQLLRELTEAAGVPCVVLGVPARHVHSHTGIIRRDDYDLTLRLLLAVIRKLDHETVGSLTG